MNREAQEELDKIFRKFHRKCEKFSNEHNISIIAEIEIKDIFGKKLGEASMGITHEVNMPALLKKLVSEDRFDLIDDLYNAVGREEELEEDPYAGLSLLQGMIIAFIREQENEKGATLTEIRKGVNEGSVVVKDALYDLVKRELLSKNGSRYTLVKK